MFKCQRCNKVTALREPCNKVVVETRPKVYKSVKVIESFKDEEKKFEKIIESRGTEIVKELRLCALCFSQSTHE